MGHWGRILALSLVVFGIDRLTKLWVVEWMNLKEIGRVDVFAPYLTFRMAWNEGINFGIFNFGEDGRWVLVGLSVVIVLVVLWWTRKHLGWIVPMATGLVVGGALGNVWDRVQYGAVADFLNMSCCGFNNPYAFNVADMAIFAGAVLLILFADKAPKREH